MGRGGVEPFVAATLVKALKNAKLDVSVLGLEAVGWVTIPPLLRFFVERPNIKAGLDCVVGWVILCPCTTAFVVANLSWILTLIGTSLRPLGGREGQNRTVSLVGGGKES